MSIPTWLIIIATILELILIIFVLFFFLRLKKSENQLLMLQEKQEVLLERIFKNTELEQALVASFSQRQNELKNLNQKMDERIQTLQKLLSQADGITRSPHFLRELIINAQKKGQNIDQIAKSTGLAKDEIEIILTQIS